jgi:hypothetical protein
MSKRANPGVTSAELEPSSFIHDLGYPIAQPTPTFIAETALAATDQRPGHYAITHFEATRVRADRYDLSGAFVAADQRKRSRKIPGHVVIITVTKTRGMDLDGNFARFRIGNIQFLNRPLFAWLP